MKKKFRIPLFIFGVLFLGYVGYRMYHSITLKLFFLKSEMVERTEEPILGVYDRNNNINQLTSRSLRHYALILNSDKPWKIDKDLINGLHDSIPVLLTVEMWDIKILKKTLAGEYDENIKILFSQLLKGNRNYYLRWNPEMDVSNNRHLWGMNPGEYTRAFEHFSSIVKKISPQVQMVWGPIGETGVMEYLPQDDYVNAASVTLNNSPEIVRSELENSIPYQIRRKLHRLRFVDTPVFILGSEDLNRETLNTKSITNAIQFIKKNEKVIYSEENFLRPKLPSKENKKELLIGLYDPQLLLVGQNQVSIEHLFINFTEIMNGSFKNALDDVISRNHSLIISVEPGLKKNEKDDSLILENISKGKYDAEIGEFYSIISCVEAPIYLRFAHEMEIPIKRYSWQSKDPVEYIRAYRYFMDFQKTESANIKKVWGPAGDRGSLEWWPGNDMVDYVSFAVYGLPDKNITNPEEQESFAQIFQRKSSRFRLIDKPFFITELGVKGDEEFQTRWLLAAAEILKDQQNVIGINYFNNQDVEGAWGEIKPPDWRISSSTFKQFIQALEKK